MTASLTALVVYSTQLLVVVTAAAVAIAIVPLPIPQARLRYWRAVAALCLGLPLLGTIHAGGLVSSALGVATIADARVAAPTAFITTAGESLLWIVAFGVVVRLAWLVAGACRLRQLRLRSVPAVLGADLDALRRALAPNAQIRWTDHLRQPVAFGVRRPVVLLPRQFATLGPEAQRAVVCHELTHIARLDWLWILVEEQFRALLWFHPAVWWLLDEMHLSREQVVDQLVVARTRSRKTYMETLLVFADAGPAVTPAIALVRRRQHLVARLGQLSKEVRMSRGRLICAMLLLAVVVAGATRAVVSALPLTIPALVTRQLAGGVAPRSAGLQSGQDQATRHGLTGPADSSGTTTPTASGDAAGAARAAQARRLKVGGAINPPAKVFEVQPVYPEAAQQAGVQGIVLLEIVIGEDGSVVESEVTQSIPELDQAAIDAVNQWEFEPTLLNGEPVEVEMTVTIRFTLS